jgi:hypothetical protein
MFASRVNKHWAPKHGSSAAEPTGAKLKPVIRLITHGK